LLSRLRYGFKIGEPNIKENNKSRNSSNNNNKVNPIEKEGEIENETGTHQKREVEERGMAHQVETTLLIQIMTTTLHPIQTVF